MPAITRLGEIASGHGCYPTHPAIQASTNVFVEGIAPVRQGDMYAPHACSPDVHVGALAVGSATVFVNGQQVGRLGDPVSCGSTVMQAAATVFAGG